MPEWQQQLTVWLKDNTDGAATLGPKLLPPEDPAWAEAHNILDSAPISHTPLDVARFFLGDIPQKWIKAWRTSEYANPVVVLFFAATDTKPMGDQTAWCAAFMNWCLRRCDIAGTNSASSQSFVGWGDTVWTPPGNLPGKASRGDVAIFRHKSDPAHGHVAFFEEISKDQPKSIVVVGGNHISGKTHLIQEKSLKVDVDLELIRVATVKGLRR